MERFDIPTAKNLETGEIREINVDPHAYTSVHDWKPIPLERFTPLLHAYATQDRNLDRWGHGLMSSTAFHLGPGVNAVIYYTIKEDGLPVSSPVLMLVNYEQSGKVIAFASLTYGLEADPDRKHHD